MLQCLSLRWTIFYTMKIYNERYSKIRVLYDFLYSTIHSHLFYLYYLGVIVYFIRHVKCRE
jgi:hypothetical protein